VKLDSAGGLSWQTDVGGSIYDFANAIQQTSDGGYIVCRIFKIKRQRCFRKHGLNDYWFVKLDTDGGLSWQVSLGGTGVDMAHSVQETSDGGYMFPEYRILTMMMCQGITAGSIMGCEIKFLRRDRVAKIFGRK
jgi:hypothetical protein